MQDDLGTTGTPQPPRSSAGASEAESAPPADRGPQATKEELGTDLSEIARARVSGTDKTTTGGERAAHASELAAGVAGTDADDDTAAAVERAPTAQVDQSHPAPVTRTENDETAPTPVPAPQAPTSAPKQFAGGSVAAPAEQNPSGTGTPTRAPSGAAGDAPAAEAAGAASGGAAKPGAAKPGAAKPGAAAAAAKPAAPAKPPEPDPDELPALREVAPDLTWERKHGYVEVKVRREQLLAMAGKCRALGYDYLSAVTGVDWRDRLEMLYHLYSYDYVARPGCIVLRVDLPNEPNPLCPSLTSLWPGADFQEREVYDLFGVKFVGHPDLRRILTEDDFPGHPLRKDWTFDFQYTLVHHLRYGAEGQDAPPGGAEGFRRV
jgi:NADH-quinone oxidoreductase subunit C